MPKIVVTTTPKNRILINTFNGMGGVGVQTLTELKDVDATHVVDGETVVYDAEEGKFKIEELPRVDGGEF